MLFKKYHIVILKDREGARNIRLRGVFGVVLLLLFIGLAGSTAYLWGFYTKAANVEVQLHESQRLVQEQSAQIVGMAARLQLLQDDLKRIQQFDSKLRVMLNVDRESADIASNTEGTEPVLGQGAGGLPLHRRDLLARRMFALADQLSNDMGFVEVRQQEAIQLFRGNRELLAATPSIWPTEGYISSTFGMRPSPFTGQPTFHAGVDISARVGTPVIAPAKGIVTFAGWDGAYGYCLILNHGNAINTRYAHLQKLVVKEGQTINRGDLIAYVGATGRTTGPHLHYEVRVGGVLINPMRYILN